jgi:hypothetical protein
MIERLNFKITELDKRICDRYEIKEEKEYPLRENTI